MYNVKLNLYQINVAYFIYGNQKGNAQRKWKNIKKKKVQKT